MEYKIFGPGGTPPDQMQRQLKGFLTLDDSQRKTIADLFLQSDFDPYARITPSVVASSSLLPEQFVDAVEAIRFLLFSWREYDLQLADIGRDLLLLGYPQDQIERVAEFLKLLSNVRERVWAKNYFRIQQLDGLPTIDNVNLICDARAVFGGFADGAEDITPAYKELLSLTPIIIMEISSSDNYGQHQRTAVQMNEEQFEWLRKAMGRAQEQLAILKERIGAMSR